MLHARKVGIGRSNINYYYGLLNPPKNIPSDYKRKIELINQNKQPKYNLKNLIIHILLESNVIIDVKRLRQILLESKIYSKSTLRPNRILQDIIELSSFDIISIDEYDEDLKESKMLVNLLKLPSLFKIEVDELKLIFRKMFKKN